jgi:hypothetical protein
MTQPTNQSAIEQIEARHAKATPGPKYVEQETRVYSEESGRLIQDFYTGADFYAEACDNAEFFAHAHADIATLLAALREAEAELARVREHLSVHTKRSGWYEQ